MTKGYLLQCPVVVYLHSCLRVLKWLLVVEVLCCNALNVPSTGEIDNGCRGFTLFLSQHAVDVEMGIDCRMSLDVVTITQR